MFFIFTIHPHFRFFTLMRHEGFGGISWGGQVSYVALLEDFVSTWGFPAWDVPSATQRSHFRQNPVVWPRGRWVGGWQYSFFPIILVQWKTGWWFQLLWKILGKLGIFPQVGVNIKNAWNHHQDPGSVENVRTIGKVTYIFGDTKVFWDSKKTTFRKWTRCKDVKQYFLLSKIWLMFCFVGCRRVLWGLKLFKIMPGMPVWLGKWSVSLQQGWNSTKTSSSKDFVSKRVLETNQ